MGNEILIGDHLRQARLNKNISLDELQKKTKIQKRYLEAIEKGAFDLLPGDYYIRTFIRQYSKVLGENGDHLVAIYDGEASFGDPLPRREKPKSVDGTRATGASGKKSWVDYLPTVLIALIAMTILFIVGYFSFQNKDNPPIIGAAPSIDVLEERTTESSATSESLETTESTMQETSESSEEIKSLMTMQVTHLTGQDLLVDITEASDPLVLEFLGLDGRCWVGVIVDGVYLMQQTLEPEEAHSLTLPEGAKEVAVILGASANVEVKINEEVLPFKEGDMPLLQKNMTLKVAYATTN